ncbi:MAG: acylphosphatase [Armatimonadota bacterium]
MAQRLHAVITGRVQNVGFRYFVLMIARELNLGGYVRNTAQQVEVVAEGDEEQLQRLVERLQQGPPAARVQNVQLSWQQPTGEFKRFELRSTM